MAMKNKRIGTKQNIQIASAILLLLCLLPMPYGFYTIVRLAMTIISGYLAYDYYTHNKKELAVTFSIIAVLFQPFIKLALGREMWQVVDVVVAILLLILAIRKK
jgi:uncharacterized integral membrane protein